MNLQLSPLKETAEHQAEIAAWRQHFESVLERYLPEENENPAILHQAMRYSALAGGKRFRPMLVYASGKVFGLGIKRRPACLRHRTYPYLFIDSR